VGHTFGAEGLQRVLDSREAMQRADYVRRIVPTAPLKERLQQLARVRTEEGYMAEVKPDGHGGFLFIENHCPICAAATACQGFCATELDLFRKVLGPTVSVERTDHIVSGDRRCVYHITLAPPARQPNGRRAVKQR
jgi:predicted ArsR family transcriptional regulator